MKLYYTKGACSLAVRIIINEINLPVDFESVDLQAKKTETNQNFLSINPKGAVPTLEIKPGEVLTENAIILQFLADNAQANQLLPAIPDFNRYRILEWLNFVATEMHKSFSWLFKPNLTQQIRDEIFLPVINAKLTFLNNHFQDHQYLMGHHFTLPDAYLFTILNWSFIFKIDLSAWPEVARYYNEIKNRPSVQKSLKQEGLI